MFEDDKPFVTRLLDGPSEGQSTRVSIFTPRADIHDENTWVARVILADENDEVFVEKDCFGADAIQAIQSAFSFVRSKVGTGYTWLGMPAVLGFPASLPSSFGIEFYKKIERLIEDEIGNRRRDRPLKEK